MRLDKVAVLSIIVSVLISLPVYPEDNMENKKRGKRNKIGGWIASGDSLPLPNYEIIETVLPAGAAINRMSSRKVKSLFRSNDTLWIGTEGGLFAHPVAGDSVSIVGGVASSSIEAITNDHKGRLWVGGNNGFSIRSKKGWLNYTRNSFESFQDVCDIVRGENGMWIATYGHGAMFINDDTVSVYTRRDSLLDNRVITVFEKNPSSILFATASGLCSADSFRWQPMRFGKGIPIGAVSDIVMDEEGRVFLSVQRHGIVTIDLGRISVFGPRHGLPSRVIHEFSLGPGGIVWAACDGGVRYFNGSGWYPYQVDGYVFGRMNILCIYHDIAGNRFLGTDDGRVLCLSEYGVKELKIPQRFPSNNVTDIEYGTKSVFFVTEKGIFEVENGKMNNIELPYGWLEGSVTDIIVLEDGARWVTSRFGILRDIGAGWEIFDRRQGLPTENFLEVEADSSNRLWFGTYDQGILSFKDNRWTYHSDASGLPGKCVYDLEVDGSGVVWAVVDGVISKYGDGGWSKVVIAPASYRSVLAQAREDTVNIDPSIRFLSENGRAKMLDESGSKTCIGLDYRGDVIIARDDGVYRYSSSKWQMLKFPTALGAIKPTEVFNSRSGGIFVGTRDTGLLLFRRGQWKKLGVGDGIFTNHITDICEDSDSNVWIATKGGGVTSVNF